MPVFLFVIPLLLLGVPWWALVVGGEDWPAAGVAAGSAAFALAYLALPALMTLGHGPRQRDGAARAGDLLLGVAWVLFTWSMLGLVTEVVLTVAGVPDPLRSRILAAAVVVVVAVLVAYGIFEARRVPRVKRVEVRLAGLGPALDGLRLAVLTNTHYGPIDRSRWSARVVEVVNGLGADLVVHTGDLADGSVSRRDTQVAPLGDVRAEHGRYYITGNHEYYSGAPGWVERMRELGWQPLINSHRVIERGGDRLVLAGIDDPTGLGHTLGGAGGGGPDLSAALAGAERELPVVLLAHQPSQVPQAEAAGVDLQISGHTHGGQIWPFHYLVLTEQPALAGLSRHGERTQLYTSRGTGFWGPPLRIFAPSEITLLTLRPEARPSA
ncbi:MAG TPA: metallophosphoesterase [Pseudonocardia sp.]|nr:metallophosphoesterase [Pseudonocardia sp.]